MKKIYIAAAAVFAAAVILFFLNVETTEEHYSGSSPESAESGYVTLSVTCTEIIENDDVGKNIKQSGVVPEDGVIIPETSIPISDGDTAFSVLKTALDERKIHFDFTSVTEHSAYVRGINNIYEYDCGDLSGWMYSVNDDFPTVSSSEYILHDGDRVAWRYTCDLGRDVGDNYYNSGVDHE